jgi:hypothetical protein
MTVFVAGGQEMLRQAVNNFLEKSLGVSPYLSHPLWQSTGYMISILKKQKAESRNLETGPALAAARRSRNEAGQTDRKIAGQKNGVPVYLYVRHFSVSSSSIRFPRSLRAISTIAVQRIQKTQS